MNDVREFGAVGDGTTDCTAALQRAAEAGGGLHLAAGTYRLTSPIRFDLSHGRAAVTGDGTATLVMAGAGPALWFSGHHDGSADPNSVTPETYQLERSPRVAGLEIVGEHEDAVGIRLEKCFKPICSGLLVRDCRIGIHLVVRNRDVLIDHCHIYNGSGQGIFLDQLNLHQINICDCHISYNRGGGIVVHGSEIRNLQIAGCDIEYNCPRDGTGEPVADVWVETRGQSLREGAITGCTIQAVPSPGGANIRFIGESVEVAHKVGLFSIAGNLISNQETQIDLRYARGVTITGNTIFSGHERNIVARDSSNLVVCGNVFDHNPDYAKETLDGIRLERVQGAALTGNILSSTLHPDGVIELRDCRDVSLVGNQILDAVAPLAVHGCENVTS